jgi:hypothetical protein
MRLVSSIASLAVVAVALAACANESAKPAAPAAAAPAAHEMKPITASANYPLKTCVVSGEELGGMGDRVAYSYDGTEVQFCCSHCVAKFEKDPAPYLAKIAAAK